MTIWYLLGASIAWVPAIVSVLLMRYVSRLAGVLFYLASMMVVFGFVKAL